MSLATPYQSASLYVGDLHPEVAENVLFELFSRVGPVASIRVCRDSMTKKSLGYAYVNFQNVQDAERTLDTMNFTEIQGKACRIMWSQRDPSLRKTGLGNVFVRNLAPSVSNKELSDTFSVFGNILSCKVVTDDKGNSKGYGYVHFETAEAAQDAIQKFDGSMIDDVEVHVGHFVRRNDRASQNVWTNLYVKHFPASWDEAKLKELFSSFGTTSSVAISKDADGKSKGFGFVSFTEHEAAAKAVAELHNKVFTEGESSFNLYVGKAQKKAERQREIKSKQDAQNMERLAKFQGMNLYVKNISDSITDEQFREVFAAFGEITSAKIMRDSNESKASRGFGFVCYTNSEAANKAAQEMNGKTLGGKPLFVTFYQRKEVRSVQLAANYAPNMRYPQNMGPGMGMPPFMNMYMPHQNQPFPGQQPRGQVPFPYPAGPMGGRGNGPRGNAFGARPGFGYPQFQQPGQMPGQMPSYKPRPQGPGAAPYGQLPGQPGSFQGPGMRRPPQQGMMPQQGMPMPGVPRGAPMQQMPRPVQGFPQPGQMPGLAQQQPVRGQVKFTQQARNQQNGQIIGGRPMMPQPAPVMNAPMQQMPPQPPMQSLNFSEQLLATTDPMQQKNMIGERLYPLIYTHTPELAGKITGMLLEMDNGELLNLIESPDALISKIEEALTVLRNHKVSD